LPFICTCYRSCDLLGNAILAGLGPDALHCSA
jgi:hypothetical protein